MIKIKYFETPRTKLDACKECDQYIASTTQCKMCGCFMAAKVLIPGQVCPLDRWPKNSQESLK